MHRERKIKIKKQIKMWESGHMSAFFYGEYVNITDKREEKILKI